MKVQEVLKKQIEKLNRFVEISSYLPEDSDICEYSNDYSSTIRGEITLNKCLSIVRDIRNASGLSSKLDSYYLATYYDKTWNRKEGISLTYRFSKLENLDKGDGFLVRFTVKNASSSLKKLGLKCRIKTVTTEAKFVKATSNREIVCPVS